MCFTIEGPPVLPIMGPQRRNQNPVCGSPSLFAKSNMIQWYRRERISSLSDSEGKSRKKVTLDGPQWPAP